MGFKGGVHKHEKGYLRIGAGRFRGEYLHILIYEWVHGPIPRGYTVHHKNGDKTDFSPANLEALPEEVHGFISARKQWAAVLAARRRRAC